MPRRPITVELAAALLIIGGATGVLTVVGAALTGTEDPFAAVAIALNAGSFVLGLAVRIGRWWLVALNYAAVLGFLDLLGSAASPQALMIGLSEILVVAILLLRKPWFDEVADVRAARLADAATGGAVGR